MSAIPYQYSVGSLGALPSGNDLQGKVKLGLTTEAKFDGSAPFTIGLWIRVLVADDPSMSVLWREGAFRLSLQNSCVAWAWGSDTGAPAAATGLWPLTTDQWHYVAISYNTPTIDGDDAKISMYIDGAPALLPPVPTNPIGNDAMQPLVLDMGGEVASVTLWSIALDEEGCAPMWGPPQQGSEGLLAAVDFANGPAEDLSGNNCSVEFEGRDTQAWVRPCIDFDGTGWAVAASFAGPPPAGAPFSFMAWLCIEGLPDNQQWGGAVCTIGYPVSDGWLVLVQQGNTGAYEWRFQTSGNPNVVPAQYPGLGQWVHIAATYDGNTVDGNTVTLYTDGVVATVQTMTSPITPPASPIALVLGGLVSSLYPGAIRAPVVGQMQGFSFWDACLSAAEINTMMTGDPILSPNCVSYFPLAYGNPTDVIENDALTLHYGAVLTELKAPFAANEARLSQAPPRLVSAKPTISGHWARLKRARELGLDGSIRPESAAFPPEQIEGLIADYDALLASTELTGDQRSALHDLFVRNLNLGLQLHERIPGPLPGTFDARLEGADLVLYQRSEQGVDEEIARTLAESADECIVWLVKVMVNVIALVLDVLGIAFASAGLSNWLTVNLEQYPTWGQLFKAIYTAEELRPQTFIKTLQSLYQFNSLGSMLGNILSNMTWWNWVYTVSRTVISIAALWLSGGAYVAAILALFVADLANLIALVATEPDECKQQTVPGLSPMMAPA